MKMDVPAPPLLLIGMEGKLLLNCVRVSYYVGASHITIFERILGNCLEHWSHVSIGLFPTRCRSRIL